MEERVGCGPLYRKLHVKGIYAYYDIDNKKFYHTGNPDNEDMETINKLIEMSPVSADEVELVESNSNEINKLYSE